MMVEYTRGPGGWRAEIQKPVHPLADPRLMQPETIATGIGRTREEALNNAKRACS